MPNDPKDQKIDASKLTQSSSAGTQRTVSDKSQKINMVAKNDLSMKVQMMEFKMPSMTTGSETSKSNKRILTGQEHFSADSKKRDDSSD